MSQTANAPRQKENEARAFGKQVRTSSRKLNIVAHMIRGKSAQHALADLTFCERRIAREVKKILQAAIANAENNHQLDVDRLYVHEATVGRAFVMKRFHARGRGKSTRIEKPFSNLTVIVKERSNVPGEAKKADKAAASAKVDTAASAKTNTKKPATKTASTKKAPAKTAAKKTAEE